ncbi:MAG: hypothetical protein NVSMB47_00130 [Polyangiales bacterium]
MSAHPFSTTAGATVAGEVLGSVFVPIRTRNELNRSTREKWFTTKKIGDAQKAAVTFHLRTIAARPPAPPLVVRLTRFGPGRLDPADGLPGSMKHVIDAVARWLGVDDRHDHLVRYEMRQVRQKEWGVLIQLARMGVSNSGASLDNV